MARKRKQEDRDADNAFLESLAKGLVSGKVQIVSAEAVAPCYHPVRDSECIGTPDAQNLWRCKTCGREWLR